MATSDYLILSSRAFGNFAVWVHDHRWLVLTASICFALIVGWLSSSIESDTSLESFFDSEDPTYVNYYNFRQDFGSDEIGYVLYTAPDTEHGVFDIDVMRKIAHLSRAIQAEVPFLREVTSLSSAEFIQSDGDDILIQDLLHDFPKTQQELLNLRDVILSNEVYVDNIVSRDASHAAIVLEMTRATTDPPELLRYEKEGGSSLANNYPQISAYAIRDILSRPEYAGIDFYNIGDVELKTVYNSKVSTEPIIQSVLSIFIIMLVGLILLGGGVLTLGGPLVVVLIAVLATVAFMATMDWKISMMFSMVPNLLMAVGVAQSVHLLSEFQLARARKLDRRDALRETLERIGNPCLLAAVSTALGFLAMAGSDLKGIANLAVYGAVGVMFTFILTITLLLSLLSFGRQQPAKLNFYQQWMTTLLTWVANFNLRRPSIVIAISIMLIFVGCIGVTKLQVDFNFLTDFKPHVKIRKDTEYAEEKMGGMFSLVYVFDAGEDGMKDPKNLQALEKFQDFAESQSIVQNSLSIVNTLKDLNQTFHGDNPNYYRITEDRDLIAQYLLMYELSGGDQLEKYMTSDFARAVVNLRVKMVGSAEIKEVFNSLQAYIDSEIGSTDLNLKVEPSGVGLLWVRLADYVASSFREGYVFLVSMIFFAMCVVFRSIKVGALSMIPNLGPIFLMIGYMGWAGINLDYIRIMVGTIAIGIAVDDTVHLVTRMRQEFFRTGSYAQAMRNSMNGVGHALLITTIILVAAFSTQLISDLAAMASFGGLLITALTSALLADLFLLPVLIVRYEAFGPEFAVTRQNQ